MKILTSEAGIRNYVFAAFPKLRSGADSFWEIVSVSEVVKAIEQPQIDGKPESRSEQMFECCDA